MLHRVPAVFAFLVMAAGFRPAEAAPASIPLRALWVWRQPPPDALVRFAEEHGIQRLYYFVPSSITEGELLQVRMLVTLAHVHGQQVLALNGKPSWGTAAGVSEALTWENEVVNSGVAFDGITLDIEPLDVREDGGQAFVAAVQALRRNAPLVELEMAQRDSWGMRHYGFEGHATLADALDATGINEVEIMSYRNNDDGGAANPNNQYGVALPDMKAALAAGVRATLGAETKDLAPAEITFFGRGYDAMQAVLAQTDALEKAGGFTNYRGVSIECYRWYSALVDAGRSGWSILPPCYRNTTCDRSSSPTSRKSLRM